ncbi:MAG TPA: hypothetical protein VEL75_08000, partial [Candidatus Methylomirabilis sp.]|nr:hypothetical protein [Candidatus Methylomirabilis sp.]
RYALRYPGWVPGCENTAEREDVYRTAVGGEGVTLISRREWNGWNRELGSALIHLFSALDRRDERALADLVPDSSLRRRLPPHLRREAICDERVPGAPATVIVAATSETEQQRVAWSLSWRRAPAGWRLVAATPVLQ